MSANDALREKDIADYLSDNPDFFVRHPFLLSRLRLPHEEGRTSSLIERQVELLREEKALLEAELSQLKLNAHQNVQLYSRIQTLCLELMSAFSLDQLIITLRNGLEKDFELSMVEVHLLPQAGLQLFTRQAHIEHKDDAQLKIIGDYINRQRPECGRLRKEAAQAIFGDSVAHIGSAALVPCHNDWAPALIAIGSPEPDRFGPDLDTFFLASLGNAMTRALQGLLKHKVEQQRDA